MKFYIVAMIIKNNELHMVKVSQQTANSKLFQLWNTLEMCLAGTLLILFGDPARL